MDLYAIRMKQAGDLTYMSKAAQDDSQDASKSGDHLSTSDNRPLTDNSMAATHANIMSTPIDHIARNAYISSKYKQMQGIRSQLN